MASIDIIEGNDTPKYFALAQEIVDTIIQEQSLEVDAVSGDTYSSKGILDAAFEALQNAVVDGTLTETEIDLSKVEKHGGKGRRRKG